MIIADGLRPPAAFDPSAPAYKDWLHLVVLDHRSGVAGLVNVSLHGAPADPRSRAIGTALFHVPDEGWVGNVETRGLGEAAIGPTSIGLEQVALAVDGARGAVHASVRQPDDGLGLDLVADALVRPMPRERPQPLGSGWVAWYVVPRLRGRGRATVAGRSIDLGEASAYYDHNWGRWHWGQDLGWEWGCFLAPAPGPVFFLSRAHRPRPSQRISGPARRLPGRQAAHLRGAARSSGPIAASSRPRYAVSRESWPRSTPTSPHPVSSERCYCARTTGTTGSRSGSPLGRRPRSSPGTPSSPATASSTSSSASSSSPRRIGGTRGGGTGLGGGRACRLSRPLPAGPAEPSGEYVSALIAALGRADPAALARMRQVVGGRRARIRLDDEEVEVRFVTGTLVVEPARGLSAVDGMGSTDRATVLDLMDGHLEVGDAISAGRLDLVADVDAVAAMFAAIEILLDASSRSPELQALAREFRERPAREPRSRAGAWSWRSRADDLRRASPRGEHALLARLDLLPDGDGAHPQRR